MAFSTIRPAMALTFFIPDFRRPYETAGRPRLPSLERIVARAGSKGSPTNSGFLAPLFGLKPDELAPAPFLHLADTGVRDGAYRLCVSFVHLAPDRDQLVLLPGSLLELQLEESAALMAAFNALYAADGWRLEAGEEGRCYLLCPDALQVETHAPEAAAGQAVLEFMPAGRDAARLKQLMNESQMLFHSHPVNRAREDADRPLINSLWLWGGGALPAKGPHAPQKIMGDEALVRGLALWAGREADSPAIPTGNEDVLLALSARDPSRMEDQWFTPLFTALKSGRVKRLSLCLGGFGVFELDSSAARRFWRRGSAARLA